MRASFVCVTTALLAVSHGHGFRSGLCHDLWSPHHAFRQWCWKSDNDGHEKEQYQLTSSQRTFTRQTNSPYPWSYDPICVFSRSLEIDICVWTDAHFANGRGISIIATPESATAVAMNKIFRDPDLAKIANSVFTSPYEIRQLPGRGLGLIANRTVKRGEKIFAHTPIVVAQAISETGLDKEHLFKLHRLAVDRLPERSRDLFLDLHGHFGGDPIYDRFGTNAFNVFDFAAIFPETARLNHDCRPNAGYYFDKATFTHKVHATREISPGEEITISYTDPFLTSQQRLERIPSQWGFKCSCTLCSSSQDNLSASDKRLKAIINLEGQLRNLSHQRTASTEMAEKLVKLYEQERFENALAKAYAFAAMEHIYVGDRMMAQKYTALAVERARLWYGPSSENVKLLESIAREPEKHEYWKLFQTV